MKAPHLDVLRYSLVAVWLITAVVSVIELNGRSLQLLDAGGVSDPGRASMLILGGAAVDALLGLALAFRPCRHVYAAALLAMSVMTLIATIMLPSLWLHPLGPLTKNLPIAAVLWVLMKVHR